MSSPRTRQVSTPSSLASGTAAGDPDDAVPGRVLLRRMLIGTVALVVVVAAIMVAVAGPGMLWVGIVVLACVGLSAWVLRTGRVRAWWWPAELAATAVAVAVAWSFSSPGTALTFLLVGLLTAGALALMRQPRRA